MGIQRRFLVYFSAKNKKANQKTKKPNQQTNTPPNKQTNKQVEELRMSVEMSFKSFLFCHIFAFLSVNSEIGGKTPCMTFQVDLKEEALSAFFIDEAKCRSSFLA